MALRIAASRGRGRGNGKPPTGGGGPSVTVDHYTVTSSDSAPYTATSVLITAQTKDVNNAIFPEAGRVITWSKTGAGGSFSNPTSVTNNAGIATVTFTVGAPAVVHTVTATDTLAKTGVTSNITVGAAAPTTDHYVVTPSSLVPIEGTLITVTAQAKDVSNVNVALAGVVVTWSKTGSGGSFSNPTAVTNAQGLATGSFTVGAFGVTHTIIATDTNAKTGTSSNIVVATATPVVDHYLVTPSTLTPVTGTTISVTAQAQDSGNASVAESGRVVTWSKTGSGGTFSAATSLTNASGIASINFTVGAAAVVHTVTATDASAKTGTSASITVAAASSGVAELPRILIDTTYPTITGSTITVNAGGDLQAAMNAAVGGDVIELQAGATFTGNYTWPAGKSGYVVIRTAGTGASGQSTRARPSTSTTFAKIVTPNVAPALSAGENANYLYLSCLDITCTPQGNGVDYNYGLMRFGGGEEVVLANQPHHHVIDRCYIHGKPPGSGVVQCQHGVVLNGQYQAIVNSWISEIHWLSTETHCAGGWAGAGPFKIVNNTFDGSSINFIYGGAPAAPGVHPSDFEIRLNHFTKPTSYFGAGFAVKNLLEWKHGQRILVEDNIFEHSWADAQVGYAINIQSGGDSGPLGTVLTADVTFRYNIVRDAPIGFLLPANPYQSSLPVTRVSITNNLFDRIGPYGPVDSESKPFQLLDNLSYATVQHNTAIRTGPYGGAPFAIGTAVATASNIVIRDNIAGMGDPYGTFFASGGYVNTNALNQWAGSSWACDHNVFYGDLQPPVAGNAFPAAFANVGFAADRTLSASSPYKNTASDGSDPGFDPALLTRTAGVIVAP